MSERMTKSRQVLEPTVQRFEIILQVLRQGGPDAFVGWTQPNVSVRYWSAIASLLALFAHPYPSKIVDGSEDVEYEALDVDRRIRKFVSGREIGAVRRDRLKDIINAACDDFRRFRNHLAACGVPPW